MKTSFLFFRISALFCINFILMAVSMQAQVWNALGNMTSSVKNIIVDGNDVYASGSFTHPSGELDAKYLARWDGESWQAVAPDVPSNIPAIVKRGNDIYIGGPFKNLAGNPAADGIARWDGNAWHSLGSGPGGTVWDMAFRGDHLFVVGSFVENCLDTNGHHLAYWDGSTWNAVGTISAGFNFTSAHTIGITEDGKVYIGGSFSEVDGISARNVAWWDEEGWHALGTGFYGDMGVTAIAVDGNDVYVGGDGSPGNGSCGIAGWNGSEWFALAGGVSNCLYGEGPEVIAASNGNVYVAGQFTHAGNVPGTFGFAHWNGTSWNALGDPELTSYSIESITIAGDDVYIGGSFLQIANVPNTSYIARWGEPEVISDIDDGATSDERNGLIVYPNPTTGIIQYSLNRRSGQLHIVTLTDAHGQVLLRKESEEWQLNLGHLPAGTYFLLVQCENARATAKVVLQ